MASEPDSFDMAAAARRGAIDLTGCTFGELKATRPLRSSPRGIVWECCCSGCGRTVTRTAGYLRYQQSLGATLSCSRCLAELRRGKWDVARRRLHRELLELWDRYGNLYSYAWEEAAEKAMLGDMEAAELQPTRESWEGPIPDTQEAERGGLCPDYCQRITDLYPINGGDARSWRCVHCGQFRNKVFGCASCMATICIDCVRDQRHCHSDNPGCTLDDLGAVYNLSRERMRQICESALAHARCRTDWDWFNDPGWPCRVSRRQALRHRHLRRGTGLLDSVLGGVAI